MYKPPLVRPFLWADFTYSVIDLETTIRNRGDDAIGKTQASPFHPDNKVYLYGSTIARNVTHRGQSTHVERNSVREAAELMWAMRESDVIVGQNFKFDLLYLMTHHKKAIMDFLCKGGMIWDTMQAEYLLTNQQEQFAPLGNKYKKSDPTVLVREGMAVKYGGTDKDDRIAEYWNEGIDTPEIPLDELTEYLDGDLKNTEIVFRAQLLHGINRGHAFMNLIQTQMQAIVATTMCEYNGMKFDIDKAAAVAVDLAAEHDQREVRMQNWMADEINLHADVDEPEVIGTDCNPGSQQQLSTVLFGGTYKHVKRLQMRDEFGELMVLKTGVHKGDPKMKNFVCEVNIDPLRSSLGGMVGVEGLASNTHGYVLDEEAIKKIMVRLVPATIMHVFLKNVLKYREISKDLNTYYIGLMNLTWPTDDCIHGSLNHCTTGTGRLSSTAPNIQNVSG